MNRHFLDVNVIIALIDPSHVSSDMAHRWFEDHLDDEWLTCPITENGAVRIVSNPRYRPGPVTIVEAVASVRSLRLLGRHRFVVDGISLIDDSHFDPAAISSNKRLTDAYLVALAAANDAVFVTLDSRLVTDGVVASNAQVVYLGPPDG